LEEKIPPATELEGRFSFIKNETLRFNVAISFQYIVFLIALIAELEAEKTTISSSIHKNMIVQTGTIVESCIHYCLRTYIESGEIKSSDVMPEEWDIRNIKKIYEISSEEYAFGAIRCKKIEHLTNRTPSVAVNRAAKRAGILSENLFKKAEKIRLLRNKIHLAGLQEIDDFYDKKDSDEAFEIAREIIENIEKKLSIA
ncbi:MAG: hypothetical protein PHP62_02810, partial [Candidatus Moranbacteria bacterium]|nr:hypothetical protein [Candidatus Moranbacteria bacterium]